jgi:hypothetical protein
MADIISHIKVIHKLYNKTDMDFLTREYDVICTEILRLLSPLSCACMYNNNDYKK